MYNSLTTFMKYNIFDHGFVSHYVPKKSKWKVACENGVVFLIVVFVGTLLAHSILMFGTN